MSKANLFEKAVRNSALSDYPGILSIFTKKNQVQAVILAGGQGTRIRSVDAGTPKSMLPIGGKPLLQHQIEWLKSYGIKEVILLVNHLKEPIISFFQNGEKWGIGISYYEEATPLGTVGGVKEIENKIKGDFLLLYGDVMADMDIHRLQQFHSSKKSDCTLVVHPNDHPHDSDLVDMDAEERINAFHPKPHDATRYYRNLVNAGVCIFSPAIFPFLQKGVKADFGKDIFPTLVNRINMFGYNTTEYLKDMGTPERLEKVNQDFLSGKVQAKNLAKEQKAIFLDRDGVLNEDSHLVASVNELDVYPYSGSAVKKINDSNYLAIVATNQSVIARGKISEDDLRAIHNKLDTVLGRDHAKLDAIYYCPHHPDKGFAGESTNYKIDCHCRKPKPGMLLDAAKNFNINLSESYFIGDAERDIEAGQRAGVTTVGVMTGKGMMGSRLRPDYFFRNLSDAVDFIIDEPYKQLFDQVKEMTTRSGKKPFVILLGGNTRSGKSSLATYLTKRFTKEKQSVLQINLDDWILHSKERKTFSVFDSFQMPRLVADIENILKKKMVELPGYAHHPSWEALPAHYQYQNEQIVLVEGVVALADEKLRRLSDLRLFKQIKSSELKKRFADFYRWKGLDSESIEKLYQNRKAGEYDIIERHEQFADIVIE
ncbi:MAG: HAD-IIIA family hydrolase [Bacteroidetes bacterium]|nr:HAD-IIIA family hydrolase [Bacteroidota bacterium]MBS1541007.1 HAD-IIIA family hydrolase [Bacteroidota bacterium]